MVQEDVVGVVESHLPFSELAAAREWAVKHEALVYIAHKHPDDLLIGHINELCARAVSKGNDLFKVLQVACMNPVAHYNLDVGQLQVGDDADFAILEDLTNFKVLETCM